MAAVSAVWGLRLTYNFYRRGGYAWPPWTGEEDYRSVRPRSLLTEREILRVREREREQMYLIPPLLMNIAASIGRGCTDTTAGLGYLEVIVICLCKISPLVGRLTSFRTVDPHLGE